MNFPEWLRATHAVQPIADEVLDAPITKVRIEAGSEFEREWCDGCMTSAVTRIPLNVLTASGVSQIGHVVWCTRCQPGGPDWS